MKAEKLKDVIKLSEKVGYVLVATADAKGIPHVAAARKLQQSSQGTVSVREWFCPGTVANLRTNNYLSIVVWAEDSDGGYQLLGRLEKVENRGILDGYAPGLEGEPPLPQIEKELIVRVEKIIEFKLGPHSDVED